MTEAGRMLPGITFAKTAYEAAFEADVLVVITEWHEFRGLDPRRIKQVMRQPAHRRPAQHLQSRGNARPWFRL